MRIVSSQVHKPEDKIAKAIERLGEQSGEAIDKLQEAVNKYEPEIKVLSAQLDTVSKAVERLEQADYSVDPDEINQPIKNEIAELKVKLKGITEAIQGIEVKPKVDVNVEPPDLSLLQESFENLDKEINELLRELDLMEADEMKKYFKQILELLEKINKKSWSVVGGGQHSLFAYLLGSQTLVNVSAVESAATPGVYGILALNADGSAIGSGGGVVATNNRVTSAGDTRVTSSGDTRVYSA